jgi:methylenetetrahydrofolate reductase (NADPH)
MSSMVKDSKQGQRARPVDVASLYRNAASGLPFSLEILPPNRGLGLESIHDFITSLGGWLPAFVSVTYHQAHKIDRINAHGQAEQIWNRKKPGTLGVCAMLKFQYGLNVIPHVICGGFSKFESEDFLVDLDYLGFNHVLALRGDPNKTEPHFIPHPHGNTYANELVEQIVDMNTGKYLEDVSEAKSTNFEIGVGGYPEVHAEARDLEDEITNVKRKIDAGASFVITQMFFDNECFYHFEKACRAKGIEAPLIPGIKVITSKQQLTVLPEIFGTSIPQKLMDDVNACETDEEVCRVGIDHAVQQARALLNHGVVGVHFFTMNNSRVFNQILQAFQG